MAKKIPTDRAYIVHGDLKIPVAIYFESRRNTRISIGAEVVHLRLSQRLSKSELRDQIEWAEKWLHRRFEKAPGLLERFKTILFKQGDRIRVMHDTYVIHVKEVQRKTSTAQLHGNDIHLILAEGLNETQRHKACQTLIHKILCQCYLTKIRKRVAELNERHFREKYSSVKLKYIHSKWGSCSTDGEIIISSKLLLCPGWVIDYVIIHELAHLVEHNHSDRFWKVVEQALPNYKRAEKWLTDHGSGLELKPVSRQALPSQLMTMLAPSPPVQEITPTTSEDSMVKMEEESLEPVALEPAVPEPVIASETAGSQAPDVPIQKNEDEPKHGSQLTLF